MTTAPQGIASHTDVTIRRAFPDDRAGLARLAALDSAPAPAGPALLAVQDGELRAALDLERHVVIADPFRPTEHLAALLRLQGAPAEEPVRRAHPGLRTLLRTVLRPTTPLDHHAA